MWNNWGGWNPWLELIIGGLEPFVIFNSAVVILRYIFPSLVPTQAKNFLKINKRGVGITISVVENFQQINYQGAGGGGGGGGTIIRESRVFLQDEQFSEHYQQPVFSAFSLLNC